MADLLMAGSRIMTGTPDGTAAIVIGHLQNVGERCLFDHGIPSDTRTVDQDIDLALVVEDLIPAIAHPPIRGIHRWRYDRRYPSHRERVVVRFG
jgi:hypothetical protein